MKTKTSALKNATTGLAGAVTLAGGSQAYGAVVSVTVPASISATATNTPTTIFFDVNGDGTPDFQLTCGVGTTTGGTPFSYTGISGAYQALNTFGVTNSVVGYTGTFANYATRLAVGATINSGSAFVAGSYLTVLGSRFGTKNYGALRTKGYVGFEFAAADGEHFGYIDLLATVAGTGTTDANYTSSLKFFNASYQTTPNTAITIAAVPEPTSLAALAFGAAGVAGAAAYRRKKSAQPAA